MMRILVVASLFFSITAATAQDFTRIELQARLSNIEDINGVAVADIDGDYDLDLFAVVRQHILEPGDGLESYLFRNNNDGTFTDITETSGIVSAFDYSDVNIEANLGMKMGASWGDFNNDGFPDLFLASVHHLQLFQNLNGTEFIEVTDASGIIGTNTCWNTGATWWDYDNDGYLDLYVSKWGGCESNFLYHNNRNGTFSDVTTSLGIRDDLNNEEGTLDPSWMGMPMDVNSDGLLDLYVTNDFGVNSRLYINKGNSLGFEEKASEYDLTDDLNGMGVAVGDPNNDGLFDIYVSDIGTSVMYTNLGEERYESSAFDLGVLETGWAWGVGFSDLDHDSDEDLIVVNGYGQEERNYYYENQFKEGKHEYKNRTEEKGMGDEADANALAIFDYDSDGDPDVLISNSDDIVHFYENNLITSGTPRDKSWLQVWLEGTDSNRDAIGTKLELKTDKGIFHRFYTGAGFMTQNLMPVHFGLADADEIIELKVTWPKGGTQTFNDLTLNQFVYVKENEELEPLSLGATKIPGCTNPESCTYNPDATVNDGSCQFLDSYTLNGAILSGNLNEEIYSYEELDNHQYNWEVKGGRIVSGQGTSEVSVRWGLGAKGLVSVKTSDENCSSSPVQIEVTLTPSEDQSDFSIARIWNEALLEAIRNDYARPTVHARNLFHVGVAMYDSWAAYHSSEVQTYLLGNQLGGFTSDFEGFDFEGDTSINVNKTISYAAYRLLSYRFNDSPNREETLSLFDGIMERLEYDPGITTTNYQVGGAVALGNYIADQIIQYGHTDASREVSKYDNAFYNPVNEALDPDKGGNQVIDDPNRWQPLKLRQFIDQAGNPIGINTPEFLSPEWGAVSAFALQEEDVSVLTRDGDDYRVHLDPGAPPYLNTTTLSDESKLYQWNFSLVSAWSSHLDPFDGVEWDISPKRIGNIDFESLPVTLEGHREFYDLIDGGDISKGHDLNPVTGVAYESQIVPRGDYARVLAEFWADGPDSETPPGHWFTLLNYVNDHPDFEKRFEGQGDLIDDLEWDVKAYFLLGGTMHDAAIAAWSAKGWYDYIRPISAIRYMAERGQSSDPEKPNYDVAGIPLLDGFIELVEEGDDLAGAEDENIGKIKIYAWRGHREISNTDKDQAGVGWILAEKWWPYQRPSFVTPPFAGYVSGHSTFSRAAAEMMTKLTGDAFFPGGIGEFVAKKNEFLVFEEGPSQDVILQWATYRDASDQCSLSRIWGGIHPPADDIPGRLIGDKVGKQAFEFGKQYFKMAPLSGREFNGNMILFPNPVDEDGKIHISYSSSETTFSIHDIYGRKIILQDKVYDESRQEWILTIPKVTPGLYFINIDGQSRKFLVR
ncbi:MAG: VCBS repeat-containing protein [Cyclobacteriaceae bacterium]